MNLIRWLTSWLPFKRRRKHTGGYVGGECEFYAIAREWARRFDALDPADIYPLPEIDALEARVKARADED